MGGQLRVLGAGDNVVDQYIHTGMMYPGGNALNFSVYAKQLGAHAAYMGIFGDDRAARHIQDVLSQLGVDISRCRSHPGENGYAQVNLVDGDRVFVGGNKGGVQHEHPLRLDGEDLQYMKQFELIHSSCYSDLSLAELAKIQGTGIRLSYDFSSDWNPRELEERCPYVFCSLLSCGHLDESEARETLRLAHRCGSPLALATMGSRGAVLYDGERFYRQEPHTVVPVDTLGAGDAFFTAFILHYLSGKKQQQDEGTLLLSSLSAAAQFAAQACLCDGAFGHGIAL
ncbi:UNVERIFIED_CONTAM: fructoselysine 6-kinase [Brevibacillus sp. OAP136]